MKNLTRHLWLAVALLAIVNPAWAEMKINLKADCPDDSSAGSTILTNLQLENKQCLPVTVRLMSSISGNANQTVGGVGVFGPVVVDTFDVPAAVSEYGPGTCNPDGYCSLDGHACSQDYDCACQGYQVTPAIANRSLLQTPPAIPNSLAGTIATFILVAEANDGVSDAIGVSHCMVNVTP